MTYTIYPDALVAVGRLFGIGLYDAFLISYHVSLWLLDTTLCCLLCPTKLYYYTTSVCSVSIEQHTYDEYCFDAHNAFLG